MTDMVFDEKQAMAINACTNVKDRIVGTTGKAGTGKTTIIQNVHDHLVRAGYKVACSAPTGKAARRIREATGLQAFTNHKLLGYGMPREHEETDARGKTKMVKISTGPRYGRGEPLMFDTLLCDEFMMVNEEIYSNLVDALKPGARICMFGDMNQLKPIEAGPQNSTALCPFERTLAKFTNVTLDTIHRQDEGSGIAQNGAQILAGRIPRQQNDFTIHFTDTPMHPLLDFVLAQRDLGTDFSGLDNQILTCMNKSWIGTKRLNPAVQQLFWSPDYPGLDLPRKRAFRNEEPDPPIRVQVGTKIIFTSNVYDIGDDQGEVMNGETGIVTQLDFDTGSVTIDFGDREVTIPPLIISVTNDGRVFETDPRTMIDLAYVLTTHKAQGSEYQHVCYVMNRATSFAQSRRNFYTGITRARKHCTLFTDQHSLVKSTRYAG
jgi:exodeoxyribonuclease V alpha subunit